MNFIFVRMVGAHSSQRAHRCSTRCAALQATFGSRWRPTPEHRSHRRRGAPGSRARRSQPRGLDGVGEAGHRYRVAAARVPPPRGIARFRPSPRGPSSPSRRRCHSRTRSPRRRRRLARSRRAPAARRPRTALCHAAAIRVSSVAGRRQGVVQQRPERRFLGLKFALPSVRTRAVSFFPPTGPRPPPLSRGQGGAPLFGTCTAVKWLGSVARATDSSSACTHF